MATEMSQEQAIAALEAAGEKFELSPEIIQRLIGLSATSYLQRMEEDEAKFPPLLEPEKIMPTAVVTLICELLEAVNMNLFDLNLWMKPPSRD
ncbi:MAG: hypothetical protein KUG69_02315 [Marinosulfonomonas sp.]|nr:hypothetical protein [Marinosulfonomonas sp.]